MSFADEYQSNLSVWSDIQYALPRLHDTALRYPHVAVLELGTRSGVSTTAFLAAAEQAGGHVWSVDTDGSLIPGWWHESSLWTFICGDDLLVELPDCQFNVVLIDTSHRYEHTLAELRRFIPLVTPGGAVFLHDTTLPGVFDDTTVYPVAKALDEFCAETGLTWIEHGGQYGLGEIAIPA
jgi:predicted O-methyltransferase YrrM